MAIDAGALQAGWFGKIFLQYTVHGIPRVAVIERGGKVAYLGHNLSEAVETVGNLLAR